MEYKKIVESIGDVLSNLHEKNSNEYINNLWENKEVPIEFQRIGEQGAELVKSHIFEDNYHSFITLNNELAKAIGLTSITIVVYPNYERTPIESNFMYISNVGDLMIDIYDCEDKEPSEIYKDIIQELFNFFRDASWVMEGVEVYNEHLEEMKIICDEMFIKSTDEPIK